MKDSQRWNRRDFIIKPAALLAASHLLGDSKLLFGQKANTGPNAIQPALDSKPIHRTLGKTGITLPIVSMGVMNADVPGLVRRSYEIGIRHFDTAAHYQEGRNEEMVGSMIKEMGVRDKVVISTKILRPEYSREQGTVTQSHTPNPAEVKAHFLDAFDGCLKRLQMDYVDILYNHSCDSEADIGSEGALEALTAIKKSGKARFVGVSSHRPELVLRQAIRLGAYDVVLTTINFTMAENQEMMGAIDDAAKSGIGVIAMKTQAGGTMRPDPRLAKPLPPATQTALLKWVLHHGSITTAIPGYTTYEQMEQNFSVASNLTYTPAEEQFLSDATVVADAQFCRQCGQCQSDCPAGVDIPNLMRSHMYAVQYANYALAARTMATIAWGQGLDACSGCGSCVAKCRNAVNIAMKIQSLKEIASIGRLTA